MCVYINFFILSLTGLEPAISRLEVWHVIQLRHRDFITSYGLYYVTRTLKKENNTEMCYYINMCYNL